MNLLNAALEISLEVGRAYIFGKIGKIKLSNLGFDPKLPEFLRPDPARPDPKQWGKQPDPTRPDPRGPLDTRPDPRVKIF